MLSRKYYVAALLPAAVAVLALAVFLPAPDGSDDVAPGESAAAGASAPVRGTDPIVPLPPPPVLPPARVALGERLFGDPRLSRDDRLACAGCHDLARGGTDRRRFAVGVGGRTGDINVPTVFNSGLNFVQFWDGRAATLEEQAAGPVHNPIEMGSNWQQVLGKLRADRDYPRLFAQAYPDGLTAANVADAIAAFERTLVTPSRFDRHLTGDARALSADEREGWRRFRDYGCTSCHQGVMAGGNMFQRFGVVKDYFADRKPARADLGRFNVTGREEDRHVFKVPSLRNVATTPPYFHDGSAATLDEAVAVMGRYQLGRDLTAEDVRLIVVFLGALTGQWRGKALE